MADIFRLAGSDVPYTPLLNLTNGMIFITGYHDGVDISGGTNVTISAFAQGDSAEMQNTNGVTVHDHGSHFDIGIDGGAQNLTAYGFQDDPDWLIIVHQTGAPTLTSDYHGGTLVTFAGSSAAMDFVADRHVASVPDAQTANAYDFFPG